MKSGSVESPKESPAGADSAEIFDFLYVDRARISALYAQFFSQGVLSTVKTVAQQTFSDEQDIGSDIKLLKMDSKSGEGGLEGIEHLYDASWSIPLEVLECLKRRSLVHTSLKNAGLGAPVLTDCLLRLIDFASMDKVWDPAIRMAMASAQAPQMDAAMAASVVEAMRSMPQVVHAHFLTNDGFLWASLQPSSLNIPLSDLTLKYGGAVTGSWKLLYLLDAWADKVTPPNVSLWSAGPLMDGVLTAIHGWRQAIGRPAGWAGVTPLLIYRDVAGWLPQVNATA